MRRKSPFLPGRFFPFVAPVLLAGAAVLAMVAWDADNPPDMSRYQDRSPTVLASDGQVLRAFMSGDDKWRLKTRAADVDPIYLRMLLAYEDKRFRHHPGVDPLSVMRAAGQVIWHRRVVSGASTISMQAARLVMPHPRTVAGKLQEMARAIQLEYRLGKDAVLDTYLTLAPFGGPVEGVRAASWKLFGKEPRYLSAAEAALLVAIPQSPGRRGVGGDSASARAGRDKVLVRAREAGILSEREYRLAVAEVLPGRLHAMPFDAPHLARELVGRVGDEAVSTHIRYDLQLAVQDRLRAALARLPGDVSAAAMVVRNSDAAVLALASGDDMFNRRRAGMVDLTRAVRSPGSTLKPFIYAMAFDRGIAHPETLIHDRKTDFYGYQPGNFDGRFHGQITIADALQQSLNIPVVKVLDRLGPQRFARALDGVGLNLLIGGGRKQVHLPIALGGAGTNLRHLTRAYVGLARGGDVPARLNWHTGAGVVTGNRFVDPSAAAMTLNILAAAPAPDGRVLAPLTRGNRQAIAYKTGTSYQYRDAWSVGTANGLTIGVWVGQVGDGDCPRCSGRAVAAPILFDLFDLPSLPNSTQAGNRVDDPTEPIAKHLRYFEKPDLFAADRQHHPEILFPQQDGDVVLRPGRGLPVAGRVGAGRVSWLLNGAPVKFLARAGANSAGGYVALNGAGQHRITLIDRQGRSDTIRFRVHFEQ